MSTIERLLLAIVIVEFLGLIGNQLWNFLSHIHRQGLEEASSGYRGENETLRNNASILRLNVENIAKDVEYYKKAYYAVFAELEQFKQNKLKKSRTPSQSKDVPVTK